MSRPKNIKIPSEQSDIYKSVLDYLKSNPELSDYDFSKLKLYATLPKKNEHKIQNPDVVIERLERFIHINGNKVIGKKELCGIMKILRPTLDKWMDCGFIVMSDKTGEFGYWELFDLTHVIQQLRTFSNKK